MAETFSQSRGAVADKPAGEDAEVVVFKHVSLAFDTTVVLRDVSFTLRIGHTKIILGASGAGKSISLKPILGLVKPGILLYDEPTTGLDPITADTIDEQIVKLRDLEEVSSILVTHQLRDAFFVATHEAKRNGDNVDFALAGAAKLEEAEFMMLKE